MYKNDNHVKWVYGGLKKDGANSDVCIDCGECLPKCPQQIEIPTELARFTQYLKDNGLFE